MVGRRGGTPRRKTLESPSRAEAGPLGCSALKDFEKVNLTSASKDSGMAGKNQRRQPSSENYHRISGCILLKTGTDKPVVDLQICRALLSTGRERHPMLKTPAAGRTLAEPPAAPSLTGGEMGLPCRRPWRCTGHARAEGVRACTRSVCGGTPRAAHTAGTPLPRPGTGQTLRCESSSSPATPARWSLSVAG